MPSDELTRLQSAVAAIHDHLHAGRVNEAHAACECAMEGASVSQMNLSVPDSAKAQVFAARFNKLCAELGMRAAFVAVLPSATKPGYSSMQMGGEVGVCKMVESAFGKSSVYQGEHSAAAQEGGC